MGRNPGGSGLSKESGGARRGRGKVSDYQDLPSERGGVGSQLARASLMGNLVVWNEISHALTAFLLSQ